MKNEEKKLQHKIVMAFGQEYPKFRRYLVEINNDTFSRNHAMARLSSGMQPGASDLVLYHPFKTQSLFIELKAKGTTHPKIKLQRQLSFGELMEMSGHYFIIDFDIDRIMSLIFSFIEDNPDFIQKKQENERFIKEVIEIQFNKKTICF